MIVLHVSDLHAPFEHPHAMDFLRDLARNLRPDVVVNAGDEIDAHNFARWPREVESIGPKEELTGARRTLKRLAKLFPVMTLVESNHSYRPWKKAATVGIGRDFLRSRQSVLETPDAWVWVQAALIDDVTFIHGEGFSGQRGAIDAALSYRRPVAIGHIHSHAGITYQAGPESTIWGLNSGCLIDPTATAFSYGRTYRHKPVLGCGAVIDRVPYFFPMGV